MTSTYSHPTGSTASAGDRGRIRVLVVDDHPAVRYGVTRLIAEQPDMAVIASAATADSALAVGETVDVAVLDYHLGARDGLWLTRRLKRLDQPPRVLIYSAFADQVLAVAVTIAGADGLLGKGTLVDELSIAIRRLAGGRQSLPAVKSPVANSLRSRLNSGEQAVFGMLLHGIAPAEIAEALAITPGELEVRRSMILRSLSPRLEIDGPAGASAPLDYELPLRRHRYAPARAAVGLGRKADPER
jgi:DNA-binding NarL/FixJ family response regulator